MTLEKFLKILNEAPETILFKHTMQVIENNYTFSPTSFMNGEIENKVGENSGSCKLFAFAIDQKLSKKEALFCFGEHYQSVLKDENGTSHQNIRNFMKTGFAGLNFDNKPLTSNV